MLPLQKLFILFADQYGGKYLKPEAASLKAEGNEVQTARGYKVQTAGGCEVQTAGGYKVQTAGGFKVQTAGGCQVQTARGYKVQTAGGFKVQTARGYKRLQGTNGLKRFPTLYLFYCYNFIFGL